MQEDTNKRLSLVGCIDYILVQIISTEDNEESVGELINCLELLEYITGLKGVILCKKTKYPEPARLALLFS